MNSKELFNTSWHFLKTPLQEDGYELNHFKPVDLPHDWLIDDSSNLYEPSIGWYKKTFHYKKEREERVWLAFDGVYMMSSLYVNGNHVGDWKYGYSSFEHEITKDLINGDNELIIKVVYESPNSRWYTGAGVYRNVWIKKRSQTYIETDGVYVHIKPDGNAWSIELETELSVKDEVQLSHHLFDGEKEIAASKTELRPSNLQVKNQQVIYVNDVRLWDPHNPNLYRLETRICLSGGHSNLIETLTQQIGFRTLLMDPQKGLFVNGKQMKLNGTCEHHDLGALGAVFNVDAQKRRFLLLKEMGVNAVRSAHNMPAKEWMELADSCGLLVVSEAFDVWERPKTTFDYSRHFTGWVKKDVKSWIRRDRNHPSLLMWSIGNEIYDTHADQKGTDWTIFLREEVLKHDPKGNGRITIASNYLPWKYAQQSADQLKLVGYNYGEKYYEQHHQVHPDWVIYGSETAAVVQSRGIYHFPLEQSILADDDEQCSALGNSSTSWGASSAEACIAHERKTDFSLGQFIWTGFDYIGEPTPYHTKNAYFGQLDTATFRKDSYYIYQAAWTVGMNKPMIHLFPYWDFNFNQEIDVRVCSNDACKIELILNDHSLGVKEVNHERNEFVLNWKVPYQHGELKAVGYNHQNEVIATAVRHSFEDAYALQVNIDKKQVHANGTDLIFAEIYAIDHEGHVVENATNRVKVSVSGTGRLIGLDSGDSTDQDSYKGVSKRLFSGKLMAIVAATLEPGQISINVDSPGLLSAQLLIDALPANKILGIAASASNIELPILTGKQAELPVRKLEIISESGQSFLSTQVEKEVRIKLYPAQATYQEVEWSVVNDRGIPSDLAMIDARGQMAKVQVKADGSFRIRCTSKNGTSKTKIISELECQVEGLGKLFKDPYQFVSAGLYDYKMGDLTNGNERGVATSRDGKTVVAFKDIDFGHIGANDISIPIFALTDEPYVLQIWEGYAGKEGSQLLADVVYQKKSKWNVYQEVNYSLNKKLIGVTSISFVTTKKMHIKGFSFTKFNPSFNVNLASSCERVYGDHYKINGDSVEQIGNNVSLEWKGFDFTEGGTDKLYIVGDAPIANSIHLIFTNENKEKVQQLIEFAPSDGYVERTFPIKKMKGEWDLIFIFLPGSFFHFKSFQFC